MEQKDEKTGKRYFELYAIKTIPGSDKARLEGEAVEDARQDFDEHGNAEITMQMTPTGARTWGEMTT